jgi:UDP-hydrolysing UDP-N-acetyl-D-glucosamine 2-epimerase
MKVIFFGNWGLANLVLQKIAALENISVLCVVTQHNKESKDPYFNCVYETAQSFGFKTFENYGKIPTALIEEANLGLSVSYSEIFKIDILSKLSILNVHPSKLPAFRGPSPIQWQIKAGQNKIGATIHFVNEQIDEGKILAQEDFEIKDSVSYNELIDSLNLSLADWVARSVKQYAGGLTNQPMLIESGSTYYHRIAIPHSLKTKNLYEINSFLNRKRLTVFSGNRAEFGIILPLLEKLAESYNVDLILSGAHTQEPWLTKEEVYSTVKSKNLPINIIEVSLKTVNNYYRDNFIVNFNFGMNYFKKFSATYPVELAIVLGDRIETYAFANASFFSQVPICHLFGGDISNVPYFDTNIRHAITKIANLHFASNKQSYENILRMGEEAWRCFVMGNISLDNYTRGNVSSKDELITKYSLKDDITILLTYHPSQFISASENFKNFFLLFNLIKKVAPQVVITFPNNDEGHEEITSFLEAQPPISENIYVVKSLGIRDYLGILKELNCIVVGNSSSGLFETAFTGTPSINIGDRQTDRPRACNVTDISIDEINTRLESTLKHIIENYAVIKENNKKDYDFFGIGNSVKIVLDGIEMFLKKPKQEQVFKKFIVHNQFE